MKLSARNQFKGTVVDKGKANGLKRRGSEKHNSLNDKPH